jgi:hypothetical protein
MASTAAKRLAAAKAKSQEAAARELVLVPQPSVQYSLLKKYVDGLRAYGLGKLAKELAASPDRLPPCAQGLGDETVIGAVTAHPEQIASNRAIFEKDAKNKNLSLHNPFSTKELVCRPVARNEQNIFNALQSYACIVDMVQAQRSGGDAYLLKVEGYSIKGGWSDAGIGYDEVRLPSGITFDKQEQDRVVFAVGKGETMKGFFASAKLNFVKKMVSTSLSSLLGKDMFTGCDIEEVHVLFGFSAYTNYSFHVDGKDLQCKPDYTFMLNLSPGPSSMFVAGAEQEAKYTFPGDVLLFDAVNVFHCSGHATARTLKLALFVSLKAPIAVDTGDSSSQNDSAPPTGSKEVKVKQEVKPEPTSSPTRGEEQNKEQTCSTTTDANKPVGAAEETSVSPSHEDAEAKKSDHNISSPPHPTKSASQLPPPSAAGAVAGTKGDSGAVAATTQSPLPGAAQPDASSASPAPVDEKEEISSRSATDKTAEPSAHTEEKPTPASAPDVDPNSQDSSTAPEDSSPPLQSEKKRKKLSIN